MGTGEKSAKSGDLSAVPKSEKDPEVPLFPFPHLYLRKSNSSLTKGKKGLGAGREKNFLWSLSGWLVLSLRKKFVKVEDWLNKSNIVGTAFLLAVQK